jgi:hypothetical protein
MPRNPPKNKPLIEAIPERLVKWKDFLKSWELEYTKVVMMEPVTQTRLEVD